MFKKLEPLEKSKHQDLRLSKIQSFGFAKNLASIQISFSEMQMASQYYPIVFPTNDGCIPTVRLSADHTGNKYIDLQGRWKVPYIPFSIRLYPFVLAKIEGKEDLFALCLDRDAEHFAAGQGEPLFTADGQPNDFMQGILNTLTKYQEELAVTKALFTALTEKGLITNRRADFQANTQPRSIDGFKGVDMEKLMTQDDGFIAGLVKNGTMPLIYSHLQSLSKLAVLAAASDSVR